MDQPPGNPPHVPAPGAPRHAPAPQIVKVVAGSGGFARAIGFVIGLIVLGIVFFAGLALGAATFFAGSMSESLVVRDVYRDGGRSTVAILPVEGVIDPYRALSIRVFVDEILDDRSIRAVVLRVDSPGGGIAPSDQIWYQVNRLKDAGLPVVASFGGLAASGGYYVSCNADHIIAEPTCITGSIGVIAQTFVFKDLLDKIGVEPVTLLASDSPEKDVGNPFRNWTAKDYARYLRMLDAAYDIFNQRVKDGRQHVITDPARVDELADGSIFTAQEAVDNGLVDAVGYLDDAVAQAEKSAGLPKGRSTVITLREPAGLLGSFLGAERSPDLGRLDADRLRTIINDFSSPRLMYLMQ